MDHRPLEQQVDKKLWPVALWLWLLWIVVAGVGVWAYPRLPSDVPVHFSATGRVNGVMTKGLVVTVMPAIIGALLFVWSVLWRLDPRRPNYVLFWKTYRFVGALGALLLCVVQLWIIARALNFPVPGVRLWPFCGGLLLLLLSNVLPRVEPNWWLGIRTPWTLSDLRVWRQTHWLAGRVGVLFALVMLIVATFGPLWLTSWVVVGLAMLWAVFAYVMSYYYYRRLHFAPR